MYGYDLHKRCVMCCVLCVMCYVEWLWTNFASFVFFTRSSIPFRSLWLYDVLAPPPPFAPPLVFVILVQKRAAQGQGGYGPKQSMCTCICNGERIARGGYCPQRGWAQFLAFLDSGRFSATGSVWIKLCGFDDITRGFVPHKFEAHLDWQTRDIEFRPTRLLLVVFVAWFCH